MNQTLVHRGPDDGDIYQQENVSIAHRRLTIIDEAGGHQPMLTRDSRYVLVFNGEIFNAAELRKSLQRRGVVFSSEHSDTEVLLHLLVIHGDKALDMLNGMFAFVFFDSLEGNIFCARDRFGIKPLYYVEHQGCIALASELKALTVLPFLNRQPDLDSLFHYFSLQYVPGEATAFEKVRRLPPASRMRFKLGGHSLEITQWWQPSFEPSIRQKPDDLTESLTEMISRAVKRWSVADVPVGCLLSGGLDSSIIVSLLAEQGHKLKTYTVGFTGPGEDAWDELALARKIVDRWDTEHHEIVLDPGTLLDDLVEMVWSLDEPYGGGLPSWSVFKEMQDGVKVAMSGTGGDELFGNYQKYVPLEGRFRSRIPGMARKKADFGDFRKNFFEKFYYVSDSEKRNEILTACFSGVGNTSEFLWQYFSSGEANERLRNRVVRTDLASQLPEEFLMMTDRFSMAHSIEARTPFLDHELAETVYGIDADIRLDSRVYKPLLRKVANNLLPSEFMTAPKRGFVIPLTKWLRNELKNIQKILFSPKRLAAQGLVQTDYYSRYAVPHIEGKVDNTNKLWTMLMFQLWWDLFIEQRPRDELQAMITGIV